MKEKIISVLGIKEYIRRKCYDFWVNIKREFEIEFNVAFILATACVIGADEASP